MERATPLSGSPEPRRDAVDGQEQRRELVLRGLLGRRRAIASQQLDLLAVHLVERGQTARQALAELGEPLGELGAPGEAVHDVHRPMILVRHEGEDLLAYPG